MRRHFRIGRAKGALSYARAQKLGKDALVAVVLPDAGEIYLSKIYSDEWMRQNQFLGKSARSVSARHQDAQLPELLAVAVSDTVRAAIATMNPHGVSQLPVFERGKLIGSLSESALFQKTMETPDVMELTVGALLEPPLPSVAPDEDLEQVINLLKSAPAVLVLDQGSYRGIITRFDVVEHLGGRRS